MRNISFVLLSLIPMLSYSQQILLPVPKYGWDSLQSRISYPEIAVRSGHSVALKANLKIDSLGEIRSISVEALSGSYSINGKEYSCPLSPIDSILILGINKEFRKGEWVPGSIDGTNKTMSIEIPIIFIVSPGNILVGQRRFMIIGAERPLVTPTRLH